MYLNENNEPHSVSFKWIVATEGKVFSLLLQELNKENGGNHLGIWEKCWESNSHRIPHDGGKLSKTWKWSKQVIKEEKSGWVNLPLKGPSGKKTIDRISSIILYEHLNLTNKTLELPKQERKCLRTTITIILYVTIGLYFGWTKGIKGHSYIVCINKATK